MRTLAGETTGQVARVEERCLGGEMNDQGIDNAGAGREGHRNLHSNWEVGFSGDAVDTRV